MLPRQLQEQWPMTLKIAIVNALKDVGKGWLSLHERDRLVYDNSKLHKRCFRNGHARNILLLKMLLL